MSTREAPRRRGDHELDLPARIAAYVDGSPAGDDAAVLAAGLAAASAAELILIAVDLELPIALPPAQGWTHPRISTETLLRHRREELALEARIRVTRAWSVSGALERLVRHDALDTIVIGSRRGGPDGQVAISSHARRLLGHCPAAIAIAPGGYRASAPARLRRIAAAYDGGPESRRALALAAGIADSSGAALTVDSILDDLPAVTWARTLRAQASESWDDVFEPELLALAEEASAALFELPVQGEIRVGLGDPASLLCEFSRDADLMTIGSRRWGAPARVVLGGTGEALLHSARCPVLLTPRPCAGPASTP